MPLITNECSLAFISQISNFLPFLYKLELNPNSSNLIKLPTAIPVKFLL